MGSIIGSIIGLLRGILGVYIIAYLDECHPARENNNNCDKKACRNK